MDIFPIWRLHKIPKMLLRLQIQNIAQRRSNLNRQCMSIDRPIYRWFWRKLSQWMNLRIIEGNRQRIIFILVVWACLQLMANCLSNCDEFIFLPQSYCNSCWKYLISSKWRRSEQIISIKYIVISRERKNYFIKGYS